VSYCANCDHTRTISRVHPPLEPSLDGLKSSVLHCGIIVGINHEDNDVRPVVALCEGAGTGSFGLKRSSYPQAKIKINVQHSTHAVGEVQIMSGHTSGEGVLEETVLSAVPLSGGGIQRPHIRDALANKRDAVPRHYFDRVG